MSTVGALLSDFRKSRRLSQLDLSMMAEVSSRHLSFIENSRAAPSREMLLRLADVLDLPLRDRNLLLSAGGYSMTYSNYQLDDTKMQPVRNALEIILDNHNPYPAIVMDACWNIIMVNEAQQKLTSLSASQSGSKSISPEPMNLLKMLFDPESFRPLIKNWEEVASFLLRSLNKQVLTYKNPKAQVLFEELLQMQPPPHWAQPPVNAVESPMLKVQIMSGDVELNLFSTLTQFASAMDVGMEELVIESYFPADEATKNFFHVLLQSG